MNQVIAILSILILLSGCTMLDHSWQGWVGGGYSIGEGKDDPGMPPEVDLDNVPGASPTQHNPPVIKLELPDEMKPAIEPGAPEIIDPAADPNAETYVCLEEKGFLECAKPPSQ